MSNYIFDLDGTLINSSERMYRLFCELIPECELSKEEYWKLKRNKVNHQMLIASKYSDYNFEVFNKIWMSKIENEKYLVMDENYPDTISVLENLRQNNNNLYLLTARQSKDGLMKELNRLNLTGYFDLIMTTEGVRSKSELLNSYAQINGEIIKYDNIFVSDMGKDLQMAKQYSFNTIGISHGFMAREKLEEYSPNRIIDELIELIS